MPKEQYVMRKEHQAFQFPTFSKYVHQEKEKYVLLHYGLSSAVDALIKASKEQSLYKSEYVERSKQIKVENL